MRRNIKCQRAQTGLVPSVPDPPLVQLHNEFCVNQYIIRPVNHLFSRDLLHVMIHFAGSTSNLTSSFCLTRLHVRQQDHLSSIRRCEASSCWPPREQNIPGRRTSQQRSHEHQISWRLCSYRLKPGELLGHHGALNSPDDSTALLDGGSSFLQYS